MHDRTRPKHSATPHDGKGERIVLTIGILELKKNCNSLFLSIDGHSLQDMDISPDRSTPLSENSYGGRDTNSTLRNHSDNNAVPPVVVLDNSNQPVRITFCMPLLLCC